MDLVDDFDHVFHDFRSRGDRVGSHETGAGGNGAQCGCFIAQEIELVLLWRSCQLAQIYALHFSDGSVVAFFEDFLVLGNHSFALLGETVSDEAVERGFRESENAGAHAQRCDIFHLHAAVFLSHLGDRESQGNHAAVCFEFRTECRIGDDDAASRHFLAVDVNGFLIQSHQAVYMLTNGSHFLRSDTKSDGGMAAFDAGCEETLAEERVPFLCQYTSQDFAAGFDALSLLAAHLPDKITFCFQSIFLLDWEIIQRILRRGALNQKGAPIPATPPSSVDILFCESFTHSHNQIIIPQYEK